MEGEKSNFGVCGIGAGARHPARGGFALPSLPTTVETFGQFPRSVPQGGCAPRTPARSKVGAVPPCLTLCLETWRSKAFHGQETMKEQGAIENAYHTDGKGGTMAGQQIHEPSVKRARVTVENAFVNVLFLRLHQLSP